MASVDRGIASRRVKVKDKTVVPATAHADPLAISIASWNEKYLGRPCAKRNRMKNKMETLPPTLTYIAIPSESPEPNSAGSLKDRPIIGALKPVATSKARSR